VLARSPDLYGEHEAGVRTVLGRLHSLAHDHFTREERLQKAAGYDGFEENRRDHQRITKQLSQIISRYEEGSLGQSPVAAQELLEFLHDWLINHIIKIDLKMRGHQFPSNVW
jgi:hemerythrin-like metal-binding protein